MKNLRHFFITSLIAIFILTSQQGYADHNKQSGGNSNHTHSSKEKHDKSKTKTKKNDKKEKHSKNKTKAKKNDKKEKHDKNKTKTKHSKKKINKKDKAKNQDDKKNKNQKQSEEQQQAPDDSPDYSLIQVESPSINSMYVGEYKILKYLLKNNSDFNIGFQNISNLSEPIKSHLITDKLFLAAGETLEFYLTVNPEETMDIYQELKIQYVKLYYIPETGNFNYRKKDLKVATVPIKINVLNRPEQPKQPNKQKEKTFNSASGQPTQKKSVENEEVLEASEELYDQNADQTPLEEDIDDINYTSTKIAVESLKPNVYVNETVQLEYIVKNKSGYEIAFQNVSNFSDSIKCIADSKTIALKPNGFAKIILNVSPKELKNISELLKIKYTRANYNETSGKYDPDKRFIKTYEEPIKLTVEDGSQLLKTLTRILKENDNTTEEEESARRALGITIYQNNCGAINTAYHKLSRIMHPDHIKNPPLGTQKEDFQKAFTIIAGANQLLQNICVK